MSQTGEHTAFDPDRPLRRKAACSERLEELGPSFEGTLDNLRQLREQLGNGEFDWQFGPEGIG